jgi:hypothetical protein
MNFCLRWPQYLPIVIHHLLLPWSSSNRKGSPYESGSLHDFPAFPKSQICKMWEPESFRVLLVPSDKGPVTDVISSPQPTVSAPSREKPCYSTNLTLWFQVTVFISDLETECNQHTHVYVDSGLRAGKLLKQLIREQGMRTCVNKTRILALWDLWPEKRPHSREEQDTVNLPLKENPYKWRIHFLLPFGK